MVELVGPDVTKFRAGDRVIASMFEGWQGGDATSDKLATVGPVDDLRRMVTADSNSKMHPVMVRTFAFEDARAAFEDMASGKHVGKVAISVQ